MPIHQYSGGGDLTVAVTNAQAIAGIAIRSAQSRLCKVLITTVIGANALNFFDNASAASGTIIGIVPAAATVGTVFTFDMPASLGIFQQAAAGGGAYTVSVY